MEGRLYKNLEIPTLCPKLPRSGVTFHLTGLSCFCFSIEWTLAIDPGIFVCLIAAQLSSVLHVMLLTLDRYSHYSIFYVKLSLIYSCFKTISLCDNCPQYFTLCCLHLTSTVITQYLVLVEI